MNQALFIFLLVTLTWSYNFDTPVTGNDCEVLILGAGTAGSVIAGRLSSDPKLKVCILERGKNETDDPYTRVDTINNLVNSAPDGGLAAIEKLTSLEKIRKEFGISFYPFALGGGPAVSASVFSCIDLEKLQEFVDLIGDPNLTVNDLLAYFRMIENVSQNDTNLTYRNSTGPIQVSFVSRNDSRVTGWINSLATEFNVSYGIDYCNVNGMVGFWPFQLSIKRGSCDANTGPCTRQSPFDTYVVPHLDSRPNLKVVTNAQIYKIEFEEVNSTSYRAKRVHYLFKGESYSVRVKDALVVSLGVINTPKLLQLSGIGNATFLQSKGIPVVKNLSGVGQGLEDHADIQVAWYYPAYETLLNSSAPNVGFLKSGFNGNNIDIEIACGIFPTFLFRALPRNVPGAVFFCEVVQVRNASTGKVNIRSSNPFERVDLEIGLDPSRMDPMIWALNKTRNVLRDFMASITPSSLPDFAKPFEALPGPGLPINADTETIRGYIDNTVAPWHHTGCSAKMGPESNPMSVVRNDHRLIGSTNTFVADLSIQPRVTTAHPSTTAAMFGERCADKVKQFLN